MTMRTSTTFTALQLTALVAAVGIGAVPAVAAGAEFEQLPPFTQPAVDPCTGRAIEVTVTSERQVVETGAGATVIYRSTATSSDGASGRGIEVRHLVGDRYDINLRFLTKHPDGHRYTVVGSLTGTGDVVFEPPTLTCLTDRG